MPVSLSPPFATPQKGMVYLATYDAAAATSKEFDLSLYDSYAYYIVTYQLVTGAGNGVSMQFNQSAGADYAKTHTTHNAVASTTAQTTIALSSANSSNAVGEIFVGKSAGGIGITGGCLGSNHNFAGEQQCLKFCRVVNADLTHIKILTSGGGNFTSGRIVLYGVKY